MSVNDGETKTESERIELLIAALKGIRALANAPYWTASRRTSISETATRALLADRRYKSGEVSA